MTFEEIEQECMKIAMENGYLLDVPVKFNNRMRSTLGRVVYDVRYGEVVPNKIEFSTFMVNEYADDIILNTIRHEMAHYLVTKDTHENHGHDQLWKLYAIRLGCDPEARTKARAKDALKDVKYVTYCSKCGQVLGRYFRKGNVIKYPSRYRSKCCHGNIRVEDLTKE